MTIKASARVARASDRRCLGLMNPDSPHFRRLHKCLAELVLMLTAFRLPQRGYAQQAGPSVPAGRAESNPNALSLAGTVVNSMTGETIRRAAVAIHWAGSDSVAAQPPNLRERIAQICLVDLHDCG